MTFEHILVPTDFSIHAREALETAIELGAAFGSSIHLIHAYSFDIPPTYIPSDAAAFMNPQDILEPIRENAEASMEQLIDELAKKGTKLEGRVQLGHASEIILAEAERLPASVIVMGTRGLTGLKHVMLGSTAERVVRMAPCPVITVKANDAEADA